jgi:calmodulin
MKDDDEIIDILHDNNRTNELKITFEIFDKDFDGFISLEEFGYVMKSLGYELSDTELQDMMKEVMKDDLFRINFEQFMLIMNKRGKDADIVEEYIEAFRVFDREGNGTVNRDELRHIMVALGERVSVEELDVMLQDADVNGDGLIEYKNFVRLMLFK